MSYISDFNKFKEVCNSFGLSNDETEALFIDLEIVGKVKQIYGKQSSKSLVDAIYKIKSSQKVMNQ